MSVELMRSYLDLLNEKQQAVAEARPPGTNMAQVNAAYKQQLRDRMGAKLGAPPGSSLEQVNAAYKQQLLDRMGAKLGLPPGSSLEQVEAAQLANLDKNDPEAAAQYRAGQPVQLKKLDPMQDPNFAQGLAAAKAGRGPLGIMLAQPDIANNQKLLDIIASSYALPAGLTAKEIEAKAKQKIQQDAQSKQTLPPGYSWGPDGKPVRAAAQPAAQPAAVAASPAKPAVAENQGRQR